MMLSKLPYQTVREGMFAFVKYRIHLSIVFALLLYGNNVKLNVNVNYPLLFSFLLWHFSLFLFDRIYDRKIDKLSQPDEYVKDQYAPKLYILVVIMMLGSLFFFLYTRKPIIYWMYLLPVTFLYPLNIYKTYRVKSIFLIKNLYSAVFIYVIPVYIHSLLLSDAVPDYINLLSLGIYVLIGEIFWDIRDITADRAHNTYTIPNTFGTNFTKVFLFVLMLTDIWIKNYQISSSAYIYMLLLIIVNEKSDRLIFHVPPLLALVNFLL
jgi:4-hydroxybenzoate polyprenyltransferase